MARPHRSGNFKGSGDGTLHGPPPEPPRAGRAPGGAPRNPGPARLPTPGRLARAGRRTGLAPDVWLGNGRPGFSWTLTTVRPVSARGYRNTRRRVARPGLTS